MLKWIKILESLLKLDFDLLNLDFFLPPQKMWTVQNSFAIPGLFSISLSLSRDKGEKFAGKGKGGVFFFLQINYLTIFSSSPNIFIFPKKNFSFAVRIPDHTTNTNTQKEKGRGIFSPVAACCFYLKISPIKHSEKDERGKGGKQGGLGSGYFFFRRGG